MSYTEALEHQVLLYRKLEGQGRQHLLDSYERPLEGMHSLLSAEQNLEITQQPLIYGETFYWPPELCTVLVNGAATLPGWVFTPEAIGYPEGFVWFARPLPLPAISGTAQGDLAAITWSIVRHQIVPGLTETVISDHEPLPGAPTTVGLMLTFYIWWERQVHLAGMFSLIEGEQINNLLKPPSEPFPVGLNFDLMHTVTRYAATSFALLDDHKTLITSTQRAEPELIQRLEEYGWTHREPLIHVVTSP